MAGLERSAPDLAVVGCGHWGRNLARVFAQLGALAAVVDENTEVARRQAAESGAPARAWEAVLADPAVGAVVLATPAETHAALAQAALRAGKDVFVEKPIALGVSDGEALRATAVRTGRVLMVGHLLRYHPAFERLLSLHRSGALGVLRYAYSNRLSFGRFRVEENVLWSFAPHDVSMLLALFDAEPEAVEACGAAFVTPGVEDEVRMDLRFSGGGHGHVFASWLHPVKEHRLVVVGAETTAVFDDALPWDRKLILHRRRPGPTGDAASQVKGEAEPIALEPDEPLRRECAHFLVRRADRAAPRTDGAEGVRVLRVLARAQARLDEARPRAARREPGRSSAGREPRVPA